MNVHSIDIDHGDGANGAPQVNGVDNMQQTDNSVQEKDVVASKSIDWRGMWDSISPYAYIVGMLALVAAFFGILYALYKATEGLGALFKIEIELARWTAIVVSVALGGHALVMAFSPHNALKMLNGVSAGLWMVIAFTLSATYSILRLVGITPQTTIADMQQLLAIGGTVIDADLLNIGRYCYAVLIALALITLTVSVWGAIGMLREVHDSKHASIGHAAASAGVTVVIVGAAIYSGLHVFTYGQMIGSDMFTSAAVSMLAELTFIAALKRAIDTGKGYYVALAVFAIGYALAINWLENRALGASAGIADAMERAKVIAQFVNADAFARLANDAYAVAGPIFGILWGMLEYATSRTNALKGKPFLSRIASGVNTTRLGVAEIGVAWNGLTSGANAMAKDGADFLAHPPNKRAPKAVSRNGNKAD